MMSSCHVCAHQLKIRFPEITDAQTGEIFAVFDCPQCGLGHTAPVPENLAKYYAAYHGGRHGATARYCDWRRFRWLSNSFKESKNRRVLDVGCGDGTFLLKAKANGWITAGTEMNPAPARANGLEVFAEIEAVKQKFGANSFDAATMWHTLEHFTNPRQMLESTREMLKPDGVVFVAVPDAGGWQARFSGRYWLHRDAPRHLFHFNFQSLDELLNQCGFTIEKSWHQEFEYDLLGWSQSFLNQTMPQPNVFFKTLNGQAGDVKASEKFYNFALGAMFSAAALPLVPIGALMKNGGTLIVRARVL